MGDNPAMATDWQSLIAGAPGRLLGLLHLGLAIWVTVHVLLHKRDVPAAIGWIGLGWLSPLLGPALYSLFGINRVERRGARLKPERRRKRSQLPLGDQAGDDPAASGHLLALARSVGKVTGAPLCPGNRLTILRGGTEGYPSMLAAIADARRSIALSAYIFDADEVGGQFVEALGQAFRRGVQIRVLIDGVGGGYLRCPTASRLRSVGIPTARFLHDWPPWRTPFFNLRSHKKLLILDGSTGFTGGLNIADANLYPRDRAGAIDDIHFRLEGPVVHQLMRSFAIDWNFTAGEILKGPNWWPALSGHGPVAARGIDSGPDEDLGAVETVLAAAIGQASHHLRIVTPYFLPSAPLMSAIALAALRGVRVDVVFPRRSDHRILDWAVQAHLSFFAAPGVALHRSLGAFDHSKLVTVDGEWCLIGSPNWDARSLRLNFEFAVECYEPAFAATIDRVIDEKIAGAAVLTDAQLKARPTWRKLRDAGARLLLPYL
jgi:cardiolipin synthase